MLINDSCATNGEDDGSEIVSTSPGSASRPPIDAAHVPKV